MATTCSDAEITEADIGEFLRIHRTRPFLNNSAEEFEFYVDSCGAHILNASTSESNSSNVEAYIVPVYGAGLWDKIYGFVAISDDFETIEGVSFGHISETPGLGARIADKEIQQRYRGKKLPILKLG